MKLIIGCCLLICLNILSACSKTTCDTDAKPDVPEFKDQLLTFSVSDQCKDFVFGNDHLKLCLDSASDSRCPEDVICIWSGVVITRFSFTKNGQVYPVNLALPQFASYSQETSVAGYTFKLISVSPYPRVNNPAPPEETKIKIEIRNY
jgi:hypothetical protein